MADLEIRLSGGRYRRQLGEVGDRASAIVSGKPPVPGPEAARAAPAHASRRARLGVC